MKISSALLLLLLPRAAYAELPQVSYVVEESAGSWQPLDPADLAKAVEHAALEVLSKPGLMQLAKSSKRALEKEKGDYVLTIAGRTVDEAETHTVYLTFEPGKRSDLPSFRASDTVVLAKSARGAMLSSVEASARKAAAQLLEVLKPQLSLVRGGSGETAPPKDPSGERQVLPWKWAEVHVPAPSAAHAAAGLFAKSRSEQMASLRELTSLALTEASPRNALERCVLEHKDHELRLGCLVALRPLARRTAPTQRVVIEAFRKDADDRVRAEANEQMTYFTGGARSDAVAAWLESAAHCRAVGEIDKLGDIPNLDIAVRSCLLECGKKPKYQRSKRSCIEMLKPVSVERRRRLLWRHLQETDAESPYYIEGAGEQENSTGTDWQWAVEAVLEGARAWDPALEELLWKRYQRTLSASSLDILCDTAEPSERMVDRLLEVVQTAGSRRALMGLERFAREKPELRGRIREKLAELLATSNYPKSINARDLESMVKQLGQEKSR